MPDRRQGDRRDTKGTLKLDAKTITIFVLSAIIVITAIIFVTIKITKKNVLNSIFEDYAVEDSNYLESDEYIEEDIMNEN